MLPLDGQVGKKAIVRVPHGLEVLAVAPVMSLMIIDPSPCEPAPVKQHQVCIYKVMICLRDQATESCSTLHPRPTQPNLAYEKHFTEGIQICMIYQVFELHSRGAGSAPAWRKRLCISNFRPLHATRGPNHFFTPSAACSLELLQHAWTASTPTDGVGF